MPRIADRCLSLSMVIHCAMLVTVPMSAALADAAYRAPRTSAGQPDLQGVWTNATMTPVERPAAMGDKSVLSDAQAAAMEQQMAKMLSAADAPSDLNAEHKSGDVGGYNLFWADFGTRVAVVNGEKRSSLTTYPSNGQLPPLTDQARQSIAARAESAKTGGFDGPEMRLPGERCLLGFGTNSGPPMLPVMYNSNYQIVQTGDSVLIQIEMVHDARIVRLGKNRRHSGLRAWMGDSIGYWEGDTLVVETVDFHPQQHLSIGGGATYRSVPVTDKLKVTERFTRTDAQTILYQFTVNDPGTFQQEWRGEMPLHNSPSPIYEYACHEGNYALPGILAGAREEEKQAGSGK